MPRHFTEVTQFKPKRSSYNFKHQLRVISRRNEVHGVLGHTVYGFSPTQIQMRAMVVTLMSA